MYLVSDQSHDAYSCEDVLTTNSLHWDTIRVSGPVGVVRFTQVTHEQVHIGTEGGRRGEGEGVEGRGKERGGGREREGRRKGGRG